MASDELIQQEVEAMRKMARSLWGAAAELPPESEVGRDSEKLADDISRAAEARAERIA